jgi:hypothetical protein
MCSVFLWLFRSSNAWENVHLRWPGGTLCVHLRPVRRVVAHRPVRCIPSRTELGPLVHGEQHETHEQRAEFLHRRSARSTAAFRLVLPSRVHLSLYRVCLCLESHEIEEALDWKFKFTEKSTWSSLERGESLMFPSFVFWNVLLFCPVPFSLTGPEFPQKWKENIALWRRKALIFSIPQSLAFSYV